MYIKDKCAVLSGAHVRILRSKPHAFPLGGHNFFTLLKYSGIHAFGLKELIIMDASLLN